MFHLCFVPVHVPFVISLEQLVEMRQEVEAVVSAIVLRFYSSPRGFHHTLQHPLPPMIELGRSRLFRVCVRRWFYDTHLMRRRTLCSFGLERKG